MEMEDIIKLIVFIILGFGVLMGVANTLLFTEQSTVIVTNQTITFINNTATDLTQYVIVSNSEVVYGARLTPTLLPLNKGDNYSVNYNSGTLTLMNRTDQDWYNSTPLVNVSYRYYPASYVADTTIRNIYSGILPLLALLLLGGLWFYFKKTGAG